MLFNNLPNSLPWYPRIFQQDRLRNHVSKDMVFAQLAPYNGILPFQFFKQPTSEVPVHWKIKKACEDATMQDYLDGFEDAVAVDLSSFLSPTYLEWGTLDGKDYFMFKNATNAGITAAIDLEPGLYYMEMKFTQGIVDPVLGIVPVDGISPAAPFNGYFTSEIFRVPEKRFGWGESDLNCEAVIFKWYHNSDLSPLHYPGDGSFYNLLYLDSFITASEPEVEIEGERDGNNELIPTFQKAAIKYKLSALVPDFIKVALYVMQIHDYKELITDRALRRGELKNIDVTHDGTSDEAYSQVTVTFEQMSLLATTSCEQAMDEPAPVDPPSGGGQTLVTTYCEPSGGVTAKLTTGFTAGYFARLWSKTGAGAWVLRVSYIPRAEIISVTGWSGSIPGGVGATQFKVTYSTFSFDTTVESALSTPSPSC
jgi:hypothetical protein